MAKTTSKQALATHFPVKKWAYLASPIKQETINAKMHKYPNHDKEDFFVGIDKSMGLFEMINALPVQREKIS